MSGSEVIYGWHAVMSALESQDSQIIELYMLKGSKDDAKKTKLLKLVKQQNIRLIACDRLQLDKLASTSKHQGVLAVCQQSKQWHEKELPELLDDIQHDPFILILDRVQDPHNLGAILRTADCAGIDVVIAPKDQSVGVNATVKKVACGAAEKVAFIPVTNLARVMTDLQERGIWIYGLAGDAEKTIHQQDLTGPIALAMGAEGAGLRQNTQKHCDGLLSIPMAGQVSSLNVSVATGVSLFEAVRQRLK